MKLKVSLRRDVKCFISLSLIPTFQNHYLICELHGCVWQWTELEEVDGYCRDLIDAKKKNVLYKK
jgi:hypothetical protein